MVLPSKKTRSTEECPICGEQSVEPTYNDSDELRALECNRAGCGYYYQFV
jgi:hypothetical protein